MYFLLDTCENPGILRLIFFGVLFRDIIFTLVPIGLILMLLIDLTKSVITDKESEQLKNLNLVSKRILYAVIIFLFPWVITAVMFLFKSAGLNIGTDYNLCIKNAQSDNFDYYDGLLEKEEEAERLKMEAERKKYAEDNSFNNVTPSTIQKVLENNISQFDQAWSSYPLCRNVSRGGNDYRTIGSAGCGFCAFTMILRSYGYSSVTPIEIVEKTCSLGYGRSGHAVPDDFIRLAKEYGLKTKYYDGVHSPARAAELFVPLLKEGKRLIVNMPGHYFSVLGINSDGTLLVGDSSRHLNETGPYTMEKLFAVTTWEEPYWYDVTVIWRENTNINSGRKDEIQ